MKKRTSALAQAASATLLAVFAPAAVLENRREAIVLVERPAS